jgi:thioredoxin 1
MFHWINHNSLYIIAFLFPIILSIIFYNYLSKNKLILLSAFLLLLVISITTKILIEPGNKTNSLEINSILSDDKPMVIEFYSPNCMGCVISEKPFLDFQKSYSERFTSFQIDIYDKKYSDLIRKYEIISTPTFVLIHKGKLVDKYVGLLTNKEKLYIRFKDK